MKLTKYGITLRRLKGEQTSSWSASGAILPDKPVHGIPGKYQAGNAAGMVPVGE